MHQFPAIRRRLQRAHGHLAHTIEMLEEGRPCQEIAQQIDAIENAKKALIEDHLQHGLQSQIGERQSEQVKPHSRGTGAEGDGGCRWIVAWYYRHGP